MEDEGIDPHSQQLNDNILPGDINPHSANTTQQVLGHGQTLNVSPTTNIALDEQLYMEQSRSSHYTGLTEVSRDVGNDGCCKRLCARCIVLGTTLKWFVLLLFIIAMMMLIVGTVVALNSMKKDIVYAPVLAGCGLLLVVVMFGMWRRASDNAEPIHSLLNIGPTRNSRHEHHNNRQLGSWHGGIIYPQFSYQHPPPTYQQSMQAYLSNIVNQRNIFVSNSENFNLPGSPPPSYSSRASTLNSGFQITIHPTHDILPNSRQPTYSLRLNGNMRPPISMIIQRTNSVDSDAGHMDVVLPDVSNETSYLAAGADQMCPNSSANVLLRVSSFDENTTTEHHLNTCNANFGAFVSIVRVNQCLPESADFSFSADRTVSLSVMTPANSESHLSNSENDSLSREFSMQPLSPCHAQASSIEVSSFHSSDYNTDNLSTNL